MKTVNFVPPRVPFVDVRTGIIAREWYLLLEQLFSWKMGDAATAATLTDITVQGAPQAQIYETMQELRQLPIAAMPADIGSGIEPTRAEYIAPDDIAPVLGLLRDEIAELRKAIEGLGIAP